MPTVLGIDTGGTFTDAVIIDLETKKIHAETKTETTHFHLIDGITKAIEQLEYDHYEDIAYASLSTTLATNALVEGRGCRVGLLLMGFDGELTLPEAEIRRIPGTVDMQGTVTTPVDKEATRKALESLRGKVDAVAISGILSVRNPEPEKEVKAMVRETLGLPCIAAHELSSALGMKERTTTTVLNARLLSVIDDLFQAVKAALKAKHMEIPIMIVKGDGSLMTEETAKNHPIETILSGPAASIIGATFLNDCEEGLILDMGGTTTDIAVMKKGSPRLDPMGACVGGWRTQVKAAEVYTYGLGGDSRICRDISSGALHIGPRRVYPISTICREHPEYIKKMLKLTLHTPGMRKNEPCEGFFLLRPVNEEIPADATQKSILELLKEGPMTICELSRRTETPIDFIQMGPFMDQGYVAMTGFTPTDLLHCTGEYGRGSCRGAEVALSLLASRWGMSTEKAIAAIRKEFTERLAETILDSVLAYEKIPTDAKDTLELQTLRNRAFYNNGGLMSFLCKLNLPVIGIGAPIEAWLKDAAEKVQAPALFPQHHQVANAVGAAAGKIRNLCHISVQNHEAQGIHVYAPWGRTVFKTDSAGNDPVQNAMDYALTEGRRRVEESLRADGLNHYEILVERKDRQIGGDNGEQKLFIATEIDIIGVVTPNWKQ